MYIIDEIKVDNNMNTSNLEYINIYGLFGRYDIEIPFDKEVNIFIGENGLGKTTILNCIYYILEKKFTRLSDINFSEIWVKFLNESNPHKVSIEDVNTYNRKRTFNNHYLDNEYYKEYLANFINESNFIFGNDELFNEDKIEFISRKFSRQVGISNTMARRQVIQYLKNKDVLSFNSNSKGNADKIKKLTDSINKNIKQKVLYLPTYRRIENDFSNLNINSNSNYDNLSNSELLIRFGMADVQNSIDKILEKIRKDAMDGFNKMTGILLKQFVDDDDMNSYKTFDSETVKIVLDRIGDEIEDTYKDKINNLIKTKEIYNKEYAYLLNLISKLIDNFYLQKKYDDRIKKFTDTCNKYLNEKHFYYNQSKLSLEIKLNEAYQELDDTINLTQLSSGEKQIVSLFSKLYLENNEDSIIIIDEPELSLSMKWQKMLLPDIMRTGNCKLLITVTHSPFIFENEFDYDAKEMRRYIKYTN